MLARARIIISSCVFLSLVVFFIQPHTEIWLSYAAKAQLIPLITALFSGAGFIYMLLFIFSAVPAVIAGRVYCSTVCPLGFIQDIFIALRKKTSDGKFVYKKGMPWIPIAMLAFTLAAIVSGFGLFFSLLEPYSIAARIMNAFVSIDPAVAYIAAAYLTAIACLSIIKGRLFCNTLCPAGSILSLLAAFSRYRLVFDRDACVNCGKCESACKAECVSVKEKTIDFKRCVGCMNCVSACPHSAVKWDRKKSVTIPGRREFLEKSAFVIGAAAAAPVLKPAAAVQPVMPPGAVNLTRFNSLCTACHTCVKACPQKVITISPAGYGILNPLRPMLDYDLSYCLYACNDCTEVCPTGALRFMGVSDKKKLSLGKADIDKKTCIGYTQGRTCNVCVEHCPVKAVYAVKYRKNLAPEMLKGICTGCGACEKSCPVRPVKSIRVRPLAVHETIPDPVKAIRPGEYNLKFIEKTARNKDAFPF